MFSLRIKTIASLIDKNSVVLDVGTDHAYLPIYLYKNGICTKIYGSDVSLNVLEYAHANLKNNKLHNKISLFKSDGLNDIDVSYNFLVICGMGFHTIKNILNNKDLPDKIVLQSNSDIFKMRKYMNDIGYKIIKEVALLDKGKYYNIIKYEKGREKLHKRHMLFGKSLNNTYYEYLLNKNNNLIKQLPLKKKINVFIQNIYLNKLLKESRTN